MSCVLCACMKSTCDYHAILKSSITKKRQPIETRALSIMKHDGETSTPLPLPLKILTPSTTAA